MSNRPWSRPKHGSRRRASPDETIPIDSSGNAWWTGDADPPVEDESEPAADDAAEPEPPDDHASDVRRGPRTAEEVREAFRKKRRNTEPEREKAVFDEYFSAESLFTTVGGDVDGEIFDRDDPYVVLGVAGSATWEQITIAHRRLAKLHHPDRLLHATAADREKSESRMREINVAYSELRRRRGK